MVMTNLAFVSEIKRPWILTTQSEIVHQDVPEGILLLELDAALMTNLEGLYREFAAVFEFPDYFGGNFNALDECITDLEWLPSESYLLVIKNAGSLLNEESDNTFEGLLSILDSAGSEWATPVLGPVHINC